MTQQSKLIIWDFDGVISDTEHLWIKNWQILLKKFFNVDWDFAKANKILGGLSPKTKIENLSKLGIEINDQFLLELKKLDWEAMKDMRPVENVVEIFKLTEFEHCIATGGNLDKTMRKLDLLNFNRYFPENKIFTAQQVQHGKPEPDLFLLAAQTCGFKPSDCFVIEDSLAGLSAGLKANMVTIAFLGCPMNNNPQYIQKVKNLGIEHIFYTMNDLKRFLLAKL